MMTLLFDLDGTLTDSGAGICRCINHALKAMRREAIAESELRSLVGAPLNAIFARLLGSTDEVLLDRAVAAYRARFNDSGIFENQVYPGMPDALQTFCRAGCSLHVVTAKPTGAAERVLLHLDLAKYFVSVHGTALTDRTCDKAQLVRAALDGASADPAFSVMVGDRAEDVRAARANRTWSVAALWGYGTRAELEAAGPDLLAASVGDLRQWLMRMRRRDGVRVACDLPGAQ